MAAGCSWISFSMKSSKPDFWACATSQSTVMGSRACGAPARSVKAAPSRVISTTSPSSTGITVVVRSRSAGMSEASSVSPSPRPTTSGEDTFTPTSVPGSSTAQTTREYAPSNSATAARTATASEASGRSRSFSSTRCATHSVSVSEASVCPAFSSRARNAWKFSMIPLWITATRPSQSRWGCALRSVGAPCVAQRVWPIPTFPTGRSPASRAASSSPSLPARFTTPSDAPSITATPAES